MRWLLFLRFSNWIRLDSTETEQTYSLLTSPFLSPRPPFAYAYLFLPPACCMSNLSESRPARAEPSSIPANLGVMLCYVLLCCAVLCCAHIYFAFICIMLSVSYSCSIYSTHIALRSARGSPLWSALSSFLWKKALCIPLPLSAWNWNGSSAIGSRSRRRSEISACFLSSVNTIYCTCTVQQVGFGYYICAACSR